MLQLKQQCLEDNALQGAFAVLFIPYTVKTEDTLAHIAEKYGTTVDLIKSFNQLQSDTVSVGRTLLVPQGDAPKN